VEKLAVPAGKIPVQEQNIKYVKRTLWCKAQVLNELLAVFMMHY
jgi:hypothetical protein